MEEKEEEDDAFAACIKSRWSLLRDVESRGETEVEKVIEVHVHNLESRWSLCHLIEFESVFYRPWQAMHAASNLMGNTNLLWETVTSFLNYFIFSLILSLIYLSPFSFNLTMIMKALGLIK